MSNLYNLLKTIIEKLNATKDTVNNLPQPDWNQNDDTQPDYVKNRPFYTGDPAETVLVEESTVTFADTGYGFYAAEFSSTFEGTVGETYKVYWDGAAYECTCVKFNNGQAIGNLSVAGSGSDTGEPFLIGIVNDGRIEIATQNTSSSHTISISAKVAPVVKIDKKYLVQSDWNQNDDTQPDYVKNKPFYLEKTPFIELTKDDFTVNDQDGYIKYMYRSTPKLDWFTSAESIAFEIEIVDINGRRYTATQDSNDVFFENDNTDDGYEYWDCYSNLFDIISGLDLDLYDDEYYYKDEWGVLVNNGGIELSKINIKIYRVNVKKIPEICLDAAIGQTAITVGGILEDSETEISPSVIVPDLRIPISPSGTCEEIYFNRTFNQLRISGDLLPYDGEISYIFPQVMPTTAGSSISFDISSEGDPLWDRVGKYSHWYNGTYLGFILHSSYSGGGVIKFLSSGRPDLSSAVASSTLGHLYSVVFKYTNSSKTLNVTIKCVA